LEGVVDVTGQGESQFEACEPVAEPVTEVEDDAEAVSVAAKANALFTANDSPKVPSDWMSPV